ncbi:helicase associated domain-containing protein [Streptomyces zhihengii]
MVPRSWGEQLPDGSQKLGVWVSNTRSRRTRLSAEQRRRLAALGIDRV